MEIKDFEEMHSKFKKLEGLNSQIKQAEKFIQSLEGDFEVKEVSFVLKQEKKGITSKDILRVLNISNKEFCDLFINPSLMDLAKQKLEHLQQQFKAIELG